MISDYITEELGFAVIPGGVQRFHTHLLKQASNDQIQFYVEIQLTDSSGTPIGPTLSSGSSEIGWVDASTPVEVTVDLTLPTTTIDPTNRMIVRLYLDNNNSSAKSVVYYTEGTSYYSFVLTSVGVVGSTSGTSGSSGTSGANGSSGSSGTSGINGANQRINLTSPVANTSTGTFSVNSTDNRLLNLTPAGLTFTPTSTGDVVVSAELGGSLNAGGYYTIYYGTGSVPTNGATGGFASNTTLYSSTFGTYDAVSLTGVITGLTINTQYWFAVGVRSLSVIQTFLYIRSSGSVFELAGAIGATGSNGSSGTSGSNGSSGTSGGGGASGPTMFNSIIAPATQSTFPYYKLNVPAITFSGVNMTTNNNTIYFVNTNLSAGEVINEVALLVTNATGLTSATYSIGLYSTTTDSAGRFFANTLVQTLGTINFSTTGRKTVTGIGYTVPSSTNGIYYVGLASQVTGTAPQIFGPANTLTPTYYGSLDGATMQRPLMLTRVTVDGTLPSSISISTWLNYTNVTTGIYYIGFRS